MNVSVHTVRQKSDKVFVLIKFLVCLSDFFKAYAVFDVCVNGCKYSSVYGKKMRDKGYCDFASREF